MRPHIKMEWSSMSGIGPKAWNRGEEKISMHPPLPGHVDLVEEEMHVHEVQHDHRIVHRHHPENDADRDLVRMELPVECLKPLLQGKDYMLFPGLHPDKSSSPEGSDKQGKAGKAEKSSSKNPAESQ